MGSDKFTAGGNPAMDWHPIQGGSRNTASCFILLKPFVKCMIIVKKSVCEPSGPSVPELNPVSSA